MISRLSFLFAAAIAAVPAGLHAQPAQPRPISLQAARVLAEDASETVSMAKAAELRARGGERQASSRFFPQLSASLGYTRTLNSEYQGIELPGDGTDDNPLAGLGNLPFGQENRYEMGLTASQAVFTGGRLGAQKRAAEAGVRSAGIGVEMARASLALEVTEAYYDAVLANRLFEVAESTLAQAEATLAQVEAGRGAGTQPEFEQLRARVARDNQKPVVIQRRSDRDLAEMRLKQLLGLDLDEPITLTTGLGDARPVVDEDSDGETFEPDTAAKRRASVRQAAEALAANEQLLRATKAQRLPSLALSTNWGRVAYPRDGLPGWNDMRTNWTVGLSIQLPLFTGGRIAGEVMSAQADVAEARAQRDRMAELAALDARSALQRLGAAEAAWEASAGVVEQAERAQRIAEIRYGEGLSTQLELSDARILLEQARANRAQAARDLEVARTVIELLPSLPLGSAGR